MEPSELPPFPTPEPPPPKPAASPAGRGMPMFLQALFLLAFWPAVYFTHEHTAALLGAEQTTREKEQREQERKDAAERIAGRWIMEWEGRIIIFRHDGFSLRLDAQSTIWGDWRFLDGHYFLASNWFAGEWRARIAGDDLILEPFEPLEIAPAIVWRFHRPSSK